MSTVLLCSGAFHAQQPAAPDPNRWEPAIQKFEDADKLNPPEGYKIWNRLVRPLLK